ncbi:hypothetical protein JKF63_05237 [Porcisia hertigi]|uniref:Right handed beta helix domain-containing protein n=1 Tax=Porcisia hertigi TaxID=2761500 RepID=A0A836IB18_9TRYP|nr:hypothetical protein JKF63_05237 [Porcisia hertigi]
MRPTCASFMPSQLPWLCRTASALVLPGVGVIPTRVFFNDGAGVRRSRAHHLGVSLCSSVSCHRTPARTLFGSWGRVSKTSATSADSQYSAAAEADALPTVTERDTTPGAPQTSALMNEVQRLRQQVSDLKEALEANREIVKQLWILSAADTQQFPCGAAAAEAQVSARAFTAASVPAKSLDSLEHRQGACYVVRTSEELTDALCGHGSEHAWRTVVLDGKLFILNPCAPVVVDRARVFMVGNNATIIGQIAVRGRGAVLSASDIFFLHSADMGLRSAACGGGESSFSTVAPPLLISPRGCNDKSVPVALMPVISATVGASVHLSHCTLSSGRDGVYLGMGSRSTLNHVRIVNCIRGLYEGVGCRASMISACVFQSNRYHMVLLGPNNSDRAAQVFHRASSAGETAATSPNTEKAQMQATYSAVFTTAASAADVLPPGFTSDAAIATRENKAHVVLQHNPITDIYEDCWCAGARVDLFDQDATAGLNDPLF